MLTGRTQILSLRQRLFIRVVLPLVLIAAILGAWRVFTTFQTANQIFDRNLSAVTIAVARDVANNEAEFISTETLDLLSSVSGGKVFYHVAGPNNAYASGYGIPPDAPLEVAERTQFPMLFDGIHSGEPVRVARLSHYVRSSGLDGFAEISVWQPQSVRQYFAYSQALNSLGVILLMLLAVMALVWFGVNSGLSPLINLRNSIKKRSPDDLKPITRPVPEEVVPLVENLNDLFGEVRSSIDARDRFIVNAAHQLRNPVSAVQALAEAALNAPSGKEAQRRIKLTVDEAKHASFLAEQLLKLERLSQSKREKRKTECDLNQIALNASARLADKVMDRGVEFAFEPSDVAIPVAADHILISEVVENLVDNALKHAGPSLSQISVMAERRETFGVLIVEDDGVGIPKEDQQAIFERFAQLDHGPGSGLGLAIVLEIARFHDGDVSVSQPEHGRGTRFEVRIPLLA